MQAKYAKLIFEVNFDLGLFNLLNMMGAK